MIVFPNAKINIGLRVLRKRRDGFHDLESLFYPLQLNDVLEILPANPALNDNNTEIYVSGLDAPSTGENLCSKAAKLFQNRYGIPPVRIHLHKKIPLGSGLGGGSSDAAYTLMALNDMFECGLSLESLKHDASELGSDCSFFIDNRPSLINGKGNIMEDVPVNLSGYYLVLVLPGIEVSTSLAYQMVRPSEEGRQVREMITLAPDQWKGNISNYFEDPVFRKYPELGDIKEALYHSGAVYASMSGSGSSIFGIFKSSPELVSQLSGYDTYVEKMTG